MFSENSLFSRIFGFLGQMIALNLLWILCSLPVVTAGASTTALFYCTLKIQKDKSCNTFKDFFKSFKMNFRQSTLVWLLMASAGVIFYFERKTLPSMPGIMPAVFSYLLAASCIPLVMIALYVFPTIAAFDNKASKLISGAFYFAAKNILYALAIAAITIAPMFFTLVDAKLFPVYLLVWILCGFSMTALADSWFLWKLFKPYFPDDGEGAEFKDTETDRYVF